MGIRIQQLPSAIVNQIAAGEMIERPASVVKELLENALDAGASSIAIEIAFGGLNQIKVSDNGQGIFAEDLALALTAHATSKIRKLDDLYAIKSMGFRGEALASIASIAKVTLSSKPPEQEHAMQVQAQDSELNLLSCARSVGTTVDVQDLFYNAPVRKRFLRSEKLEFQAIETVVKRFALSAFQIHLTLKHNGKMLLNLPAAWTEHEKQARLSKLFGSAFVKDAYSVDVARGGLRLQGWLSGLAYQRSQNDRQWVYINQRMVKDKLIYNALKQGYQGLLHPGRFPACALYLTMQIDEVDVNVHPTKHEVRFQQPRLVHDFITSVVAAALLKTELSFLPSELLDPDGCLEPNALPVSEIQRGFDWCIPAAPCSKSLDSSGELWDGECRQEQRQARPESVHETSGPYLKVQQSRPYPQSFEPWVVLNDRYVLMKIEGLPYVVDVKKLHTDWLQQCLLKATLPLPSRPLLVPLSSSQAVANKKEVREGLAQLGIQIIFQEQNQCTLSSIPTQLPYLDLMLLLDLVVQSKSLDWTALMKLVVSAQVFDPRLVPLGEQMELHQMLLKNQNVFSIGKALTEDVCRMLLHG